MSGFLPCKMACNRTCPDRAQGCMGRASVDAHISAHGRRERRGWTLVAALRAARPASRTCSPCPSSSLLRPARGRGLSIPGGARPVPENRATDAEGAQVGDQIGGYRLLRLLGDGSTSSVFLGEHVRLGRKAAIKVLTSELTDDERTVRRLINEARVVNDIQHPNIIDISDFVEQDAPRRVALVMEYVEGPSLKSFRGDPLPYPKPLPLCIQLVDAVQAAHSRGVIHRDLKPDNVILEQPGDRPRIVDFGVSRVEGGITQAKLTQHGVLVGTPGFMAPELAGERHAEVAGAHVQHEGPVHRALVDVVGPEHRLGLGEELEDLEPHLAAGVLEDAAGRGVEFGGQAHHDPDVLRAEVTYDRGPHQEEQHLEDLTDAEALVAEAEHRLAVLPTGDRRDVVVGDVLAAPLGEHRDRAHRPLGICAQDSLRLHPGDQGAVVAEGDHRGHVGAPGRADQLQVAVLHEAHADPVAAELEADHPVGAQILARRRAALTGRGSRPHLGGGLFAGGRDLGGLLAERGLARPAEHGVGGLVRLLRLLHRGRRLNVGLDPGPALGRVHRALHPGDPHLGGEHRRGLAAALGRHLVGLHHLGRRLQLHARRARREL
ncbi:MAG: serine/threonine protein kinase [Myxococcales bacterium]|nr:serine/threonine protein kinase [Myxococcales bacterium]